jgi:hypothetical protein
MKMLAEYLDTAIRFEQMPAHEKDQKLKADFERQAADYRKPRRKEGQGIRPRDALRSAG